MAWTRQTLVNFVKARIEEASSVTQTEVISETMIVNELNEAAFNVLCDAKRDLVFPAGTYSTPSAFITTLGTQPFSVIIPIASTFIRFLRVKVQTWNRGADDFIENNTNVYRNQVNPNQGATVNVPMAALIPFRFTTGADETLVTYNQALECFPAPESKDDYDPDLGLTGNNSASGLTAYKSSSVASGKKAIVPELHLVVRQDLPAEAAGASPWPDKLTDSIVWLAAERCAIHLREFDVARALIENYKIAVGGKLVGMKSEDVPLKGRSVR